MTDGYVFTATTKSAEAPDIEPGLYDATFEGVTKQFVQGGDFGDGDRLKWLFTLLDDDGAVMYDEGDPLQIDGLTSMSTNTKSKTTPKAVRYLKALMTAEEFGDFEDGAGFKAEDLVGRTVQVDVAIKDSGWPTIVSVLPKRQARRSRAKSAVTTGDAD